MAAIGRFQKGDDIFYAKVVDGELFKLKGDVFGSPSFAKKSTPRKGIKTLIPVQPSKVIAVGLNYVDHARESGLEPPKEPLFWLKAPTSLIADGGKIDIPFPNHDVHFEAELAVVIGRRVRNVTPAAAARYILATRPRKTSATARSRRTRVSGRGPNPLTPLRRWVPTWRIRSTRTASRYSSSKTVNCARTQTPAS
jgi:hypothetical protein